MTTDGLIRALAADRQVRSPPWRIAATVLPLALLAGLAALLLTLGSREDLWQSLAEPDSALRFVLASAAGLIGLRLALLLARPEGRWLVRLWPVAGIVPVALAVLLWAWLVTPPEARQMALMGKTIVTCLVAIPLLSILPVTALLATLRHGATTAPALAGFAAGLGGSGLGAVIYALHCTEDSPLFWITWYGLAMIGVTLVSTLIGARLLRW